MTLDHLCGHSFHGRKDAPDNAFRYSVDYIVTDLDPAPARKPRLFSRNRFNLMALHDRDHGGARGRGRGRAWIDDLLAAEGLQGLSGGRVLLIAQPRVWGHVFNPVSFWLIHDGAGALRAVVAEVNNTFGQRHCYLCHRADFAAIGRADTLSARKVFHVSPFQPVDGGYRFRFDIRADRIGIWIHYDRATGGLLATLVGRRAPLTDRAILGAALCRPFGSLRVLALIHWQALRLWRKGAPYHPVPAPPAEPVSR
jgi:DUF1365 family protein